MCQRKLFCRSAYAIRTLPDWRGVHPDIEKASSRGIWSGTFHWYTYSHPVIVQAAQKCLEVIMAKSLLHAPKRLQHMLMHLQCYQREIQCCPGWLLELDDILSRAQIPMPSDLEERESGHWIHAILSLFQQQSWWKSKRLQKKDMQLPAVKRAILAGSPEDKS